ncbi:Na(+)/H(+) antiporter subunit B [Sneathiella glossodoripedis]|uniref:Na(+)/H(+) antiporter subunit B n=1 Tax=Sneathiella glossodoripedis TaxID=418853 RepID=UPI00055D6B61|nr:Na(+)/H(+) antiporter subunit B [Sneathiella glossodoripedis]
MEEFTTVFLMALLVAGALGVLYVRNLFVATMLLGAVSFLMALIFIILDAVDVAFTEAAVGAGISTVLFLGTLSLVGADEKKSRPKTVLPLLVSLIVGGTLVYATFEMPVVGSADNPVQTSNLTTRFIEQSPKEIGVPNMVTSVLASYRGYDTFGEVTVIFTAGIAVLLILRQLRRRRDEQTEGSSSAENTETGVESGPSPSIHDLVPHVVSKLLIPFVLLFGLYVQFHGDFGPGGGFQAGVIFAAGIILYSLVFGLEYAQKLIPLWAVELLLAVGVLLYGGVGVATMLYGGNFLDYNWLSADPVAGQHLGILLVELGVGITVTAAMLAIFYGFANRNEFRENSGE